MDNFNDPLFNDGGGLDPAQASFPELYIRNFLNDQGNIPLELTPLTFTIETFSAILNQIEFTVSQIPSALYSPIVYLNGSPQYKDKDYTINSRIISFTQGILIVGDVITVRYVY